MACGLPSVDVAGRSGEAEFGRDGGVEFAAADPLALADALQRLLEDRELWTRRSEAGLRFVRDSTWAPPPARSRTACVRPCAGARPGAAG